MIVFNVDDYSAHERGQYCASLGEARDYVAAALSGDGRAGEVLTITRVHTVAPRLAGVVAMLNGEGYAEEVVEVERWRAVPCGDCGWCEIADVTSYHRCAARSPTRGG